LPRPSHPLPRDTALRLPANTASHPLPRDTALRPAQDTVKASRPLPRDTARLKDTYSSLLRATGRRLSKKPRRRINSLPLPTWFPYRELTPTSFRATSTFSFIRATGTGPSGAAGTGPCPITDPGYSFPVRGFPVPWSRCRRAGAGSRLVTVPYPTRNCTGTGRNGSGKGTGRATGKDAGRAVFPHAAGSVKGLEGIDSTLLPPARGNNVFSDLAGHPFSGSGHHPPVARVAISLYEGPG